MSPSVVSSPGPQQVESPEQSPVPDVYLRSEQDYRPYPFEQVRGSLPEAYVWPEELRPTRSYEEGVAENAWEEEEEEEEEEQAEGAEEAIGSSKEKEEESDMMNIPVVDLSEGVESEAVRTAIVTACQEWGVFYVANHGVPAQVLQRAHRAASRVFRLSPDAKAANARRAGSLSGFGKPHISKFYDSLMWSEGFTVACDSIATLSRRLFPADPAAHLYFTSTFEEYAGALRELSSKILGALLLGLNVDVKRFESTHFELRDCPSYFHLNYYPPCPQPMMTIGLAPHTDSTLLTILYQGDDFGLETWKGQWKLVAPIKDSLIVHVGDLLQIISNDKYKSPLHRALVNKRKERLSVVYLYPPPATKTLYPIEEGIDSGSLYKPLSWLDYVQAKGKYFMGAFEYFKNK
uniref:Gibberellin 3 oxidase 1 n=1 Tax=Lygodium japonicum TaxID=13824 RepID=A0A0B6VQH6_LYGJA|nr:gibberellin 3 oxidase 1 [Lygodium japonicum]